MSDYKRNPRGARRARKSMGRKAIVVLSLMMVLVLAAVGGTLAWLTDSTDAVTNTFTVGDINITLGETTTDFKMVPGNTIAKDPKVTVLKGSEDCWLFVKVDKSTSLDTYISYAVDETVWTALDGAPGVYYKTVDADANNDQPFNVLSNDQVTVKNSVTKSMMEDLKKEGAVQPTLTFTAYACQKDNITSAADAWEAIQNNGIPTT